MSTSFADVSFVFDALPGSVLLLQANAPDFTLLALSDDLLPRLASTRAEVVGRSLWAVCTANPALPGAAKPAGLASALQHALLTRQATQYAIGPGWSPHEEEANWVTHIRPVSDATGEVRYLVLSFSHGGRLPAAGVLQGQESASYDQTLLEACPIATALYLGPEIRVQYANALMLEYWGKDPSVVGKTFCEALPGPESRAFQARLEQVYATGEAYAGVYEKAAVLTDGAAHTAYFDFTCKPLRTPQGHVYGIHHTATDVTDEVLTRQKSEARREELEWFKFMADQARDLFILVRENGTFAYLNTQALETWGYTAREAQQLHVADIDPTYQPRMFALGFAKAQREIIPPFETLHKRKDGHVFPVEVSMNALVLGGKPHLLAVARDITQKKRDLEALQESEERFRIMADAAPSQVWAVHPDSSVRYVNRTFLEFVGLDLPQYLAKGWFSFLHPSEAAFAQRTLEQAIDERKPYSLEHRMRRHDGVYRWFLSQGAPSYYANGELYGYVGAAIDITELKLANEQLVRINNDLDNFVYTASHDLKAPISNIEGLLHALLRVLPPETLQSEQVLQLTALMQESVERFSKTIANLTDVAKLQKEHSAEAVPVQLATAIREVLLDLQPQLGRGHLQVEVDETITIRFSEKNIRSVVYNLLSNALKYCAPEREPHIVVRCEARDEHHVLTVADNGLGLDANQQRQLFIMFKRLHSHVEGSGVGLYMVKKIMENSGGRIEVESTPGLGSTFRVYFAR
ncbi:PAS domain-containing sensor histidine kinase [Hymenobacter lutimineralis]|uniref:histidine kinase n=1 Tax=Hymenobacter lutimineralis TaxID=2606448 RepID=A0A5D6URY2_9BACT|nr:PAS domain-containing sensor histidine kinase [Hymenobacter lutimineralis]TYZ06223.1 PAS domain-containing sensor histidine kinase [Hymenobacter lutimineralis]